MKNFFMFAAKAKSFAVLFVLLFAVSASAAIDFSTLTDGVSDAIDSVGTVLMGIGAAIVSLALIVGIIRLVKGTVRSA